MYKLLVIIVYTLYVFIKIFVKKKKKESNFV